MKSNIKTLNHTVTMDDASADDEFITAAEFENATRTVVRTLGNNHDLDVVYAGDGAKTDGKTVYLPAQDPSKLMTKKQYAVGQGFANHETMHNLCTDMDFFTSELDRFDKEGKKLAKMFSNAIEDVRIEMAARDLYPGMPSQISSTADYAAKAFNDDYLESDDESQRDMIKDFKRVGPIAVTWRGRQRMGYESPYIDKCLDALSPEMLQQLDKWIDMVEGLETGAKAPGDFDQEESFKGSRRVTQLAEALARDVEEVDEEEEEEQDNGQGGGLGGDGSADGSGGDGGANHGAGAGGMPTAPDPHDVDMNEAVTQLMREGDDPNRMSGIPLTTEFDSWELRDNPKAYMNESDGHEHYRQTLAQIQGKTAVMKRKLERALLTASQAEYVSGQRSGKLDVRKRGVSIMNGRSNVYRKKIDGQDIDTAVSILVDGSGSMQGSRMALAQQVCIALAECFEKTNVDLEVLVFTGDFDRTTDDYNDYYDRLRELEDQVSQNGNTDMFHRTTPIMMSEVKSFDRSIRECYTQLGNIHKLSRGNTPDGDGILKTATRLLNNKRSKKIMMVLCDGGSGYCTLNGMPETQYTKAAIDFCTTKGITMVGIGIQHDGVERLYKNNAIVNDLADLDKSVIDNVARMILGERFKVDNGDLDVVSGNFKRRA